MAQSFEALYSPRGEAAHDSADWTHNDKIFDEMGRDLNFERATGRDAFLEQDLTAESTPDSPRPSPRECGGRPSSKTTIEMAFERRREARATPRSTSARTAPRPAWMPLQPADEEPGSPESARSGPLATTARPNAKIAEPVCEVQTAASATADTAGHSVATAELESDNAWSTQQRLTVRTLAGAAIALVIGTGIGYMAGKGLEPSAAGTIQSSDSGLKLRLERDLQH